VAAALGKHDAALLVGGLDDSVERFGGVLTGWEHADVIDHDEVGAGADQLLNDRF
jgi:hypothetical protein